MFAYEQHKEIKESQAFIHRRPNEFPCALDESSDAARSKVTAQLRQEHLGNISDKDPLVLWSTPYGKATYWVIAHVDSSSSMLR